MSTLTLLCMNVAMSCAGARLKLVNCTIVVPPAASGLSAADTDVLAPLRWLMSNTTLGGTFHLEQVKQAGTMHTPLATEPDATIV